MPVLYGLQKGIGEAVRFFLSMVMLTIGAFIAPDTDPYIVGLLVVMALEVK